MSGGLYMRARASQHGESQPTCHLDTLANTCFRTSAIFTLTHSAVKQHEVSMSLVCVDLLVDSVSSTVRMLVHKAAWCSSGSQAASQRGLPLVPASSSVTCSPLACIEHLFRLSSISFWPLAHQLACLRKGRTTISRGLQSPCGRRCARLRSAPRSPRPLKSST